MRYTYQRIISSFIVVFLFFSLIADSIVIRQVDAATNTGDWVIYDVANSKVDGNIVSWTSVHNAGQMNQPRYKTQYYYMSKEKYNTQYKFTEGSNSSILRSKSINVKIEDAITTASTKVRIYSFLRKNFLKLATGSLSSGGLGITAKDIRNNGNRYDVYLNPVYDRYMIVDDGTEDGKEVDLEGKNIFGYQEMKAWFPTIFTDLYNIKFTLTASNIFNVEYVAVDEQNNTLDNDLDGVKREAVYEEEIEFPLPNNKMNITKNGVKYSFDNSWYYMWTEDIGGSEVDKASSKNTGSVAQFTAPDVIPGTTLTVYFKYKKAKSDSYKVKVVAETENGTHIKDLQSDRDTYGGASFNFNMPAAQKFLNSKYTYQNKWKLIYTSKNGTEKTTSIINEEHIKNYIMPDAKKDSTAVFHMIYSTSAAPSPIPTPKPDVFTPPNITPPPSDSAHMEFTAPVNTGVINADNRGAEKFTSVQGVPTTESLYGQVTAKDYLVGYSFVKKVGVKYYPITVKKDYILSWMTATPTTVPGGGPKQVSETITVTQTVTVARAYAYWEIQNFECYKIGSAVLRNYALPNEAITIYPDYSFYHPPRISINHFSDESYHILPPNEYSNGITLPPQNIVSSGTSKPTFGNEDFSSQAWSMTGNIRVRSDYLNFNGTTVMNDSIAQTIVPDINRSGVTQCETFINQNVLYKPNNIIEATKVNGTFASNGTITYTAIATVNATRPTNPQYSIDGINKVVIHTPVICIPSITDDNDKHSQLINPSRGCNQLVLDPDPTLSDFVVSISNTGPHSNKQGYYSRDFSMSLRDPNISYIAEDDGVLMNQVKFPFDVIMDKGVAYEEEDDAFIKASTWLTIGRTKPRFYLPMTVNEGVYTVQFRTVAVNGLPYITRTEEYANKSLVNYVASNTLNVEVSGRIYGLTIYDISDYPIWEEVFRVNDSMDFKKDFSKYTVGTGLLTYSKNRSYTYALGTNDQYGVDSGRNTKYTFPLVNGSHPYYKNMGILKTGYMVRFSLDTTGNMFSDSCKLSIKPNFYYVDKDGKNRIAVDLYYSEAINNKAKHLVKVGSPLDQTNLKTVRTGDLYLGIREAELKQTAGLRGMTISQFTAKSAAMFSFSEIRLGWAFRTYINNAYTNKMKGFDSFKDMKNSGILEAELLERMQRWYGQYYIPNEVHVVEKDFDVMDYADKHGVDYNDSFWLKDGYIIVNISIETIGEDGSRRLSYINATNYKDGHCSMWLQEGPVQTKKSSEGTTFHFYAGDFVIYYANKLAGKDYDSGAIY